MEITATATAGHYTILTEGQALSFKSTADYSFVVLASFESGDWEVQFKTSSRVSADKKVAKVTGLSTISGVAPRAIVVPVTHI